MFDFTFVSLSTEMPRIKFDDKSGRVECFVASNHDNEIASIEFMSFRFILEKPRFL